ncbi:unnamed protein product [Citrullus colocynthis]|uniref:Uncharacterized protein n=1 Tax=Citrullus colocynthis TaxID=252529 RepID=A0ABP0XNJ2_9ROSI
MHHSQRQQNLTVNINLTSVISIDYLCQHQPKNPTVFAALKKRRLNLVNDGRRTLLKIRSYEKMRNSDLILKKLDRRSLHLTLKRSLVKISNLTRSLDLMLKKPGTSLTKLRSADWSDVEWLVIANLCGVKSQSDLLAELGDDR